MHSTREKSKKKKTYYSNLSLQTQLREKKETIQDRHTEVIPISFSSATVSQQFMYKKSRVLNEDSRKTVIRNSEKKKKDANENTPKSFRRAGLTIVVDKRNSTCCVAE